MLQCRLLLLFLPVTASHLLVVSQLVSVPPLPSVVVADPGRGVLPVGNPLVEGGVVGRLALVG